MKGCGSWRGSYLFTKNAGAAMFTELSLPPNVELDWKVNGMCKGGNVVIGWGWIIIAGKWKVTDSKYWSWQLGSWNEYDEKDDSLSNECSNELFPLQTM